MNKKKCPACGAMVGKNMVCAYCGTELIENEPQKEPIESENTTQQEGNQKITNLENTNPKPKINVLVLILGFLCFIVPGVLYLRKKLKEKQEWQKRNDNYIKSVS